MITLAIACLYVAGAVWSYRGTLRTLDHPVVRAAREDLSPEIEDIAVALAVAMCSALWPVALLASWVHRLTARGE